MDGFQPFRCILHGSFRKHFDVIRKVHSLFTAAGIEVLAPSMKDITSIHDGFAFLSGEEGKDKRLIELLYLHNLKKLGENGFSYFIDPEGYIGTTTSYELGIAQLTNVRCLFAAMPNDHPAYIHKNLVWKPEDLVQYIQENNKLPDPYISPNERMIAKLWNDLMVPGSVVSVGGIIEYGDHPASKEVLLVRTHKWQGRYSVVGGKVKRGETLAAALRLDLKYQKRSRDID